jgi:hypothetical protein
MLQLPYIVALFLSSGFEPCGVPVLSPEPPFGMFPGSEVIFSGASIEELQRQSHASTGKSLLPDGIRYSGSYEQYLHMKTVVRSRFERFGLIAYFDACSSDEPYPIDIANKLAAANASTATDAQSEG